MSIVLKWFLRCITKFQFIQTDLSSSHRFMMMVLKLIQNSEQSVELLDSLGLKVLLFRNKAKLSNRRENNK